MLPLKQLQDNDDGDAKQKHKNITAWFIPAAHV